ncbi:MAG: DHH family phosphoesterase [Bacteroidetes bacterium]|nr:DHH family phosphoesterase [Bacteroidota bacterium]
MIDFSHIKEILNNNNSFLITTHVNPDADAIGSELAFYHLLKRLGKEPYIVNNNSTPYNLEFLDKTSLIQMYNKEVHDNIINSVDVIVFLDLNHLSRVVRMEETVRNSGKIFLCIDHHQNPENISEFMFVDESFSSTGEIIFDLIKETKLTDIDYEIALPIYAAIMTDTGSFRFERTTADLHRKTAELLEAGVTPKDVFNEVYDNGNLGKLKLLGEALVSLNTNSTGEIGYIIITQDILKKTGADETDVDGFVNYCLSTKNSKIGILFFELNNGIKISFRSKSDIPVNKLAAEFGGGGHFHAAGTRLFDVSLEEYVNKVIMEAEKYLIKYQAQK